MGGISGIFIFKHFTRRTIFLFLHIFICILLFGIGISINFMSLKTSFICILILTFLYQALTSVLFIYQTEVLEDNGLSVTYVIRLAIFLALSISFMKGAAFYTLSVSLVFYIFAIIQLSAIVFVNLLVVETKGL